MQDNDILELQGQAEPLIPPRPVPPAALSRSGSWRTYAVCLGALDSVSLVLGLMLAYWLRFRDLGLMATGSRTSYLVAATLVLPAWLVMLLLGGAYERRCLGAGTDEYRRVFDAALRFLALIAVVALVFELELARGFVALAVTAVTVLTLVFRYLLRQALHHMRNRGHFTKRVLVVGSELAAAELLAQLAASGYAGLSVVAACLTDRIPTLDAGGQQVPVLGDVSQVVHAVVMSQADVIAIADADTLSSGALRRLAWQLEGTGVELMVAPAVTDIAGPRISIRPVSGLPLLLVEEPELNGLRRVAKGTFDRVVSATALVVSLPLLLLIAASVRLTTKGPALFKQVRVGIGGRHFVMWKFRTMSVDAEQRLGGLAHLNEHDGVLFKIREDPRITPVGRILRRWSLDELPQLWNVLWGDMSIVGPRPPLPSEVERYSDNVRRRLLVKPGLTGLWQVSGRAGLPWEEAVRLDLYYVENWSLSMDAMVIAKTVAAVLRRQGAC